MVEQGRSWLCEDEHGRILDRLAGLEKVIPRDAVTQALVSTDKLCFVERYCRETTNHLRFARARNLNTRNGNGSVFADSLRDRQQLHNRFSER